MAIDILHIVASYDISDPKRLTRVARAMKGYGERVLKSVFECNVNENRFEEMKGKIEEIIEPIEDSVRYYITMREMHKRGRPFWKRRRISRR